jgi:REP element-mobilizing transposase RayT
MLIPKYRRKVISYKLRKDIQGYIIDLCKRKGVKILKGI